MLELIVIKPGDTKSAVLGRIERLVGEQHQRVGARGVVGTAGDPDADADLRFAESGKQMGTAERGRDALRGLDRLDRGRIGQHDRKLVAAQPRRGVVLADALQQPFGDFLEQRVAGGVAEPVVDILEAVEIEAEQRAGRAGIGLFQRIVEACIEQQTIWKLGQAVVLGQEFDLRFGAAALGNVFIGADPAAVLERLVIDRDQPPVAELLQERSLLALVDEGFTGGIDIVDAAARIIADRATV